MSASIGKHQFSQVPVETLIEEASLALLDRWDPNYETLITKVIAYLEDKEATPRHLGAFSYVVKLFKNNIYNKAGIHFIYAYPAYAPVYFAFGGNNTASVRINHNKPTLAKKFNTPMVDYSTGEFTSEYFDIFGKEAPFYCLEPPRGKNFNVVIEENMLIPYISAGLGPQMAVDTTGIMTVEILLHIISYCIDKPWLSHGVYVFRRIRDLCTDYTIDIDILISIAECMDDKEWLNQLETYEEGFRVLALNQLQIQQVMALPTDIPISTDKFHQLLLEALEDTETIIDRAVIINQATITALENKTKAVYGTASVVYENNDKDALVMMPPIDIEVYSDRGVIYVLSSKSFEELSVGHNPLTQGKVDKNISNHICTLLDHIRTSHLLYPPGMVDIMFEHIIHPQNQLLPQLNISS
jgi:hypothetical protein